ncbi:MAG: hypothetical protein GWN67_21805 [Phycisphaerae bacterium]|nr:hypothetical protein [Phycisphaerae bacterium]NIV14052.1 hypothetical protein [Fodinibius sp.]NIW92606.1 hypothetical protein [Phycisphaerae bacterium]
MSEHNSRKDSCPVLLIDATEAEVMQLRKDMPGWPWLEAPKGWPFTKKAASVPESIKVILVFAHKNKETRALDVCKHIFEDKTMDDVTLLVAASRYQMTLANDIRRLTRGHFIFRPIEEEALLNKINEIRHAKY